MLSKPLRRTAAVAAAALPAALFTLLAAPPAAARAAAPAATAAPELTLETIMADPDWIGSAPDQPYWADDGRSVYYQAKRQGSELRDLYQLKLADATPHLVADAERGAAGGREGAWSHDRRQRVYVHDNNVFLRDLATGALRQLTRTPEEKKEPRFMAGDRRVSFRAGDSFYVYDLASGRLDLAADLRLTKDPDDEDAADFLQTENLRLFSTVKREHDQKREKTERDRELRKADPTRLPLPWYLGDKVKIADVSLSPSGDWMLVATRPKDAKEGKVAVIPHWVDERGYVEAKDDRPLVGTDDGSGDSLILLDLRYHQRHNLDLAELPGIKDDPLKAMRDAAAARKAKLAAEAAHASGKQADGKGDGAKTDDDKGDGKGDKPPAARAVRIPTVSWSDDGRHVAVEIFTNDHKDRWIASVDLDGGRLVSRHRATDSAWISWDHNTIGWLADNETLFFESEESGFCQLYLLAARDGRIRQLTSGKFEVGEPVGSADGRTLYYVANVEHPGQYDVWKADVAGGKAEQLTHLGGLTRYFLSPDEHQLLLAHSSIAHPDELYLQPNHAGAEARRLTDSVSPAFQAIKWTIPEIVAIPSSHGAGAIYSRVYAAADAAPGAPGGSAGGHHPAVVFIHGAGYLQDAHYGWSYYFHEFMFHTLLTRQGYVVLDMDYRASAGYGRDWRTAIYRQMGHPELEDLQDGVDWLVHNRGVDRARIGVYGGSYGGFLTLMALFRAPDLFAAGAALRPVTDWATYNDVYTGAILNTPSIDPEAYERSSPIEFAGGLAKPLLICHGMVDDNVFFQDSVRLVERLIELKKENFELAPFPVESHGFTRPTSWLDEYRRIYKLMAKNLQ